MHLSGGRPAWVGQRVRGAPAVSVVVTSGDHRLATVSVSAPAGKKLLDRVRRSAISVNGSRLALLSDGVIVAGPAALKGSILGQDGRCTRAGPRIRAQTVALPGYDPPARLVAATDTSYVGDDLGALQRRLELVALVSLLAIGLLAAALTRPLLAA